MSFADMDDHYSRMEPEQDMAENTKIKVLWSSKSILAHILNEDYSIEEIKKKGCFDLANDCVEIFKRKVVSGLSDDWEVAYNFDSIDSMYCELIQPDDDLEIVLDREFEDLIEHREPIYDELYDKMSVADCSDLLAIMSNINKSRQKILDVQNEMAKAGLDLQKLLDKMRS